MKVGKKHGSDQSRNTDIELEDHTSPILVPNMTIIPYKWKTAMDSYGPPEKCEVNIADRTSNGPL